MDGNRPYAEVVEERRDGSLMARYEYGLEPLRTRYTDLDAYPNLTYDSYPVQDGLSSTRAITDPSGNVRERYGYDAFGNTFNGAGQSFTGSAFGTRHLFNGQWYDTLTGNYHLRAREYRPGLGVFLSQDPYEGDTFDPVTLHRYLYAGNDPVNFTDPSGRFTQTELNVTSAMNTTMSASSMAAFLRIPVWAVRTIAGATAASMVAATVTGGLTDDDGFDNLLLIHGTTEARARSLMKSPPSLNISNRFDEDQAMSFSMAPHTQSGSDYVWDYAVKKSIAHWPDEGHPAVVYAFIPKRIVAQAELPFEGFPDDPHFEYLFYPGKGLESLQQAWMNRNEVTKWYDTKKP